MVEDFAVVVYPMVTSMLLILVVENYPHNVLRVICWRMHCKQRNYSLAEWALKDCNVFEETQGIYSTDDRWLNHTHYIFRTRISRVRIISNEDRTMDLLRASLRIIFFHNLPSVYFHEHRNPTYTKAFVHELDHENHRHINVWHRLWEIQWPNHDYWNEKKKSKRKNESLAYWLSLELLTIYKRWSEIRNLRAVVTELGNPCAWNAKKNSSTWIISRYSTFLYFIWSIADCVNDRCQFVWRPIKHRSSMQSSKNDNFDSTYKIRAVCPWLRIR